MRSPALLPVLLLATALPVTAADFLAFVRQEPEWRRDEAPPLFVGEGYLASWDATLETGEARGPRTRPVTGVSWFAARAYCASRSGRLPTTHEWEYAASFPEEGWIGSSSAPPARWAGPTPPTTSPS